MLIWCVLVSFKFGRSVYWHLFDLFRCAARCRRNIQHLARRTTCFYATRMLDSPTRTQARGSPPHRPQELKKKITSPSVQTRQTLSQCAGSLQLAFTLCFFTVYAFSTRTYRRRNCVQSVIRASSCIRTSCAPHSFPVVNSTTMYSGVLYKFRRNERNIARRAGCDAERMPRGVQ